MGGIVQMPYTLRTTSLVGAHLDSELSSRGANTSGTTARKQERLRRFREVPAPQPKAHPYATRLATKSK